VQRLRMKTSDQPLGELFAELADDFRAWLTAELAVIKAQVENNTRKLVTAGVLLVLAAVIALAGIVVLAHTLVFVLAPYFGAPLAGFVIGLALIILSIGCLFYARSLTDLSNLIPGRLRQTFSSEKTRRP
jgi:putative superfamily III holin-X